MFRHDDERRVLVEWGEGAWTVAKVVRATASSIVGGHYHEQKDEAFLLLSGFMPWAIVGDDRLENVYPMHEWLVPRGTYHEFALREGSVLLGLASAPFDPEDEIGGRP